MFYLFFYFLKFPHIFIFRYRGMADDDNNRRLFEHFIVAGLSENPEELTPLEHECGNKPHEALAPITDITVIFPGQGEQVNSDNAF